MKLSTTPPKSTGPDDGAGSPRLACFPKRKVAAGWALRLLYSRPPNLPTCQPADLPTSHPPDLLSPRPPILPTSRSSVLPTSRPPILPTSRSPILPTSHPPELLSSRPPILPSSHPPDLLSFHPSVLPSSRSPVSHPPDLPSSRSPVLPSPILLTSRLPMLLTCQPPILPSSRPLILQTSRPPGYSSSILYNQARDAVCDGICPPHGADRSRPSPRPATGPPLPVVGRGTRILADQCGPNRSAGPTERSATLPRRLSGGIEAPRSSSCSGSSSALLARERFADGRRSFVVPERIQWKVVKHSPIQCSKFTIPYLTDSRRQIGAPTSYVGPSIANHFVETRPLTVSTKGRRLRPLLVVSVSLPPSLPLCASQVRHSAILPRERVLCIEGYEGSRRSEESGSTHRRSDATISSNLAHPTPGCRARRGGSGGGSSSSILLVAVTLTENKQQQKPCSSSSFLP
jgi:hypothetical protein